MTRMIEITKHLAIPEPELTFAASRSSGPGGQHVNKVSSRVTLRFDVAASPSLSEAQKQRIRSRLATRMTKDGVLRVTAQAHRSQTANRRTTIERFVILLQEALATTPPRRPTKTPPAAKQRRLADKRRRSQLKQQRSPPSPRDA